jgi:hypothetical protein
MLAHPLPAPSRIVRHDHFARHHHAAAPAAARSLRTTILQL